MTCYLLSQLGLIMVFIGKLKPEMKSGGCFALLTSSPSNIQSCANPWLGCAKRKYHKATQGSVESLVMQSAASGDDVGVLQSTAQPSSTQSTPALETELMPTPMTTFPSAAQTTSPSTSQTMSPSTPQTTSLSTLQTTSLSTSQTMSSSASQTTSPSTPQNMSPSTPQSTSPSTPQTRAQSAQQTRTIAVPAPQATSLFAPQTTSPSSPRNISKQPQELAKGVGGGVGGFLLILPLGCLVQRRRRRRLLQLKSSQEAISPFNTSSSEYNPPGTENLPHIIGNLSRSIQGARIKQSEMREQRLSAQAELRVIEDALNRPGVEEEEEASLRQQILELIERVRRIEEREVAGDLPPDYESEL
ncbi:hypothetical protein BDP27DRAFT_1494627 [Rhodocollybia butyracea]|uniref:Uncharacterized protein n=1 Tax=Rhodocollybia butyracea TaxID=206335 RepID=A0A9P5TZB4_9AGAR|nr:hypothetical protein BDP27DRAFT_1494627 [Rhodocollybia butyracea]